MDQLKSVPHNKPIEFTGVGIKSVKADFKKGAISLNLVLTFDEGARKKCNDLAIFPEDAYFTVSLQPMQEQMDFGAALKETLVEEGWELDKTTGELVKKHKDGIETRMSYQEAK